MLSGLIVVAVFLTVVLGVWGLYALVVQAPVREQQKVVALRLESLLRAQERGSRDASVELFKQDLLATRTRLQRLLLRLPRSEALSRALRQADWQVSVPFFLAISVLAGAAGLLAGMLLWGVLLVGLVLAGLAACGPYLYLMWRRKKRLEKFLEQFPDAIDLMSRAVRAGHAIASGFDMVASEMEAPVAEEFRQTHDEQKFGLPVTQALLNLNERVPLLDVRMMGTAIAIQREVGGNLAEVLDNIAHTIRERFKIQRQVKVYTAQGRLTGYILAALPILVGLGLSVINPEYFKILFEHEYGIFLLGSAALFQVLGYFWIRKIINIKI